MFYPSLILSPKYYVRKIEDILGEDQFGLRREQGIRDAIEMMRIIAERTLQVDEELCVCFIYWQKASDRVNWTKVMQIVKGNCIDWRERRLGPFSTPEVYPDLSQEV
jgi:hypothetical protein